MALFALQVAYAPIGWSALLKDPQHRLEATRPVIERLGGKILHGWVSFGEYDVLVAVELPDAVSAAALSMAISAGGAAKAVKTTPLLSFEDAIAAMRKASQAGYAPPKSEIPYFGVYRQEG